MDFRTTSAVELAHQVRTGSLSARDLVRTSLDRIAETNPTLNAFVAIDEEGALKAAAEIDERVARGEDPGPLAGLPLGVKDAEDAAGFRTTGGSETNANRPPATEDSELVARLRRAGAIVIGKTNMPEYGLKATTDNSLFGVTRNPWDPTRTPGGSSGGSSAAIAAGMVPIATASDGGGSIRIPSATCGLPGLKPSPGQIPSSDRTPPGWPLLSTKGVLAARVDSLTVANQAARGFHRHDWNSLPVVHDDWLEELATKARNLRILWCPTLGYAEVDAEVAQICRDMLSKLERIGCTVEETDKAFQEDPGVGLGNLVGLYMARNVEGVRGTPEFDKLDPAVLLTAELNLRQISPFNVIDAIDARHRLMVQLDDAMEGYDLLMSPTLAGHVAVAEQKLPLEVLLQMPEVQETLKQIPEDMRSMVDAVLDTIGELNLPTGMVNGIPSVNWAIMTQGFNMTGSPAGTVNAGFDGDGLPVGLQVIGHRHADVTVLRTLQLIEGVQGDIAWP